MQSRKGDRHIIGRGGLTTRNGQANSTMENDCREGHYCDSLNALVCRSFSFCQVCEYIVYISCVHVHCMLLSEMSYLLTYNKGMPTSITGIVMKYCVTSCQMNGN